MIHHHVDRFVQLNRTLGKKFAAQETSLRAFADFAAKRSITHLTAALILEWAGGAATPYAAQARFDRARALAVFLHAEDSRHEIPAMGLLGRSRRRRPAPHILTRDQISRIMQEALLVPGLTPISPLTYHNLFGLLASTGLRISEALSLQCDDVTTEGLMVRSGKFGKSRLVPIHISTRAALERYLEARAAVRNANDDLFVLGHGHAPTKTRAHVVFVRIVRKLGYRNPTGPGPRLHDLRHTFAVRSLEACGNNPQAVLRHMKALSTYLGHVDIANTYWYLEATPVLLKMIAATAEETWIGGAA
ncbi:MAG: tyrosine-type recombinase/integrase [Roseovarius sp.]|jgi:integrase|uniref:tyrosine-type recombinase/integrase n=1 Tax=Aestuariivita sp. TaxID=1872407 RepID=UPI001BC68C11|nr:tyrosine-type recombinase/integrase [Aestuariivita sp.]MBS4009571.1 tyrosine-type recombinase/integrase [Roseovarius sp.]MCE8008357.1 tyrosine-type recombinase/integrase [Aestuariivita sp.]